MKTLSSVALAGAFALGLATVAQAQEAQIPSLSQTNPPNPVATDGSPLPHNNAVGGALLTGRSAFVSPVGGIVGAGVGTAGNLVGAGVGVAGSAVGVGVGVAGSAVDTGLNATGTVVHGTMGAVDGVVR